MFTSTLVTLLAATAVSALPSPNLAPRADPKPWQITKLNSHSPSGRPGNAPEKTLDFTIHEPNSVNVTGTPTGIATLPPVTADCHAEWVSASEVPYNVELPCSDIEYGAFTFKIIPSGEENTSATSAFGLEIYLHREVRVLNNDYIYEYEAADSFKVGDNLSGTCGGSGVCNFGLSTTPYEIQQNGGIQS